MSNCIKINNKLHLQQYTFEDKIEFEGWYHRIKEENYRALLLIWNNGMNVYLIFKKIFFFRINIGFVSVIDCGLLNKEEKELINLFGVPKKYDGMFINDMRLAEKFRHKGIGTQIAHKIFESKNRYLLHPTEDGERFWKKFGFEYNKVGKFAVMDNR